LKSHALSGAVFILNSSVERAIAR